MNTAGREIRRRRGTPIWQSALPGGALVPWGTGFSRLFSVALLWLLLAIGAWAAPVDPTERPTTAIEPANCMDGGCHAEVTAYQKIHGPVGEKTCDACHLPDSVPKHTFTFGRENQELCTFCHYFDTGVLPVIHEPIKKGECLGCHNPHGGTDGHFMREATIAGTCGRCHESVTHDRQFLHDPAKKGECTNCHQPHASSYPMLLEAVGNELCLKCHKDFDAQLASVTYKHKAVEIGCDTCHDPHGSDYPMEVSESVVSLCLGCHDDIFQDASSTHEHPGIQGERSCLTCHTPHGGNLASLMCEPPVRMCMDCHARDAREKLEAQKGQKDGKGRKTKAPVPQDEELTEMMGLADPTRFQHTPVREGRCDACHTIHGGEKARLLREQYSPEFYQGFDAEAYALCFTCHDPSMLDSEQANGSTNFRDGNRNLHYLHVAQDELGHNCRDCHGIHTSTHQDLVRERVTFGNWDMALRYDKTMTGATCNTGCHPQQSYDRVNPVCPEETTVARAPSPRIPAADRKKPVRVSWAGTDVHGAAIRIPEPGCASVLLFLRADQVPSSDLVRMVGDAAPQLSDAQVIASFSGATAVEDAVAFEAQQQGRWPVVADMDGSLARSLGVRVWPEMLVLQGDGTVLAHYGGASPSLAMELAAYLDFASMRIDRPTLQQRLSENARVADTPGQRALWHLQMGRKLLAQGRAGDARETLAEGLKLNPESAELMASMAGALISLDKSSEALKFLDRIPAGAVSEQEMTMLRARTSIAFGQWDKARELVMKILDQNQNLGEAHYLLGSIYEHEKNFEKAAEEYRKASKGPGMPGPL